VGWGDVYPAKKFEQYPWGGRTAAKSFSALSLTLLQKTYPFSLYRSLSLHFEHIIRQHLQKWNVQQHSPLPSWHRQGEGMNIWSNDPARPEMCNFNDTVLLIRVRLVIKQQQQQIELPGSSQLSSRCQSSWFGPSGQIEQTVYHSTNYNLQPARLLSSSLAGQDAVLGTVLSGLRLLWTQIRKENGACTVLKSSKRIPITGFNQYFFSRTVFYLTAE
jgi:hypothetical protein